MEGGKLIDAHCHLNFVEFDKTRDEVVNKTKKEFKYLVDSGTDITTNMQSLEISKKYDGFIKSTMGYHPNYAGVDNKEVQERKINQLIKYMDYSHAIGEIGLDYKEERSIDELKRQEKVFRRLIDLSIEYDKTIVLHVRNREQYAMDILKEYPDINDVVFHCFSGSKQTAQEIVDYGFYVSFATNALFSKKHKKNIKSVPIENMLTETDSPYLSPEKGELNNPCNIRRTIERIERTKKISFEEIEKATEKNAIKIYNL